MTHNAFGGKDRRHLLLEEFRVVPSPIFGIVVNQSKRGAQKENKDELCSVHCENTLLVSAICRVNLDESAAVKQNCGAMDFDLSKPQKLLRDSARALLSRECPHERVRALAQTETAFDEGLWQTIADQGWLGLLISEEYGGLGLGLVDMCVVVEEMEGLACRVRSSRHSGRQR